MRDNFSILKISQLDIRPKCYFAVAKVKPLVLKMKIDCIHCFVKTVSINFDSTFKQSHAVTTWTPITAYKLLEYLINIHSLDVIQKKNNVVINVHLIVCKHDIFLCLKFIDCAFCSDLKSENIRDSVQRGRKK